MSAVRKSLPGKRSVTLYISVIALISIFFIGFFFYYVPANRDALNKYAFSILQSMSSSIRKKHWNNINIHATDALKCIDKSKKSKTSYNDFSVMKNYVVKSCVKIDTNRTKTNSQE